MTTDPLELELQGVLSHKCGCWELIRSSARAVSICNNQTMSFQLLFFIRVHIGIMGEKYKKNQCEVPASYNFVYMWLCWLKSPLLLFVPLYLSYVFTRLAYVCRWSPYHSAYVVVGEQLSGTVLSLHSVGLLEWAQVIRLGSRQLSMLRRFTSSSLWV